MLNYGFNIGVLFIVTAAFYFMVLILPRQAKAHQHLALYCFQYSLVMPFLAFIAFTLRFEQYQQVSVFFTSLFLLSALYLFYFGIRARFAHSLLRRGYQLAILHVMLFAVKVAERMRAAVESLPVKDPGLRVTLSLGVSQVENIEDLYTEPMAPCIRPGKTVRIRWPSVRIKKR